MRYPKSFFIISILIFVSCSTGSSEDELTLTKDTSTSTTITVLEQTPETSTTTTTSLSEEICTGDNNKNIDFTKIRNIQIFLNKYNFNAGDEDGYLGLQTTNAIRRFQTYAGLYPDGDAGPITLETMNNWTGCETQSTQVQNTTTTTTLATAESTTTTTTPSSTTTTVVSSEINTNYDDIGYFASVSLSDNNIQTILNEEFEEKKMFKSQDDIEPEDSLYAGSFPSNNDKSLMSEFHEVDWEKKFYISNKFIDERYKYFAQRLIYEEAPQVLPRPDYEKIHKNIAKQILSTDNEKWNTLPKSYHELDTLREKYESQGDEEKLVFLEELDDFLQDLEKKYN